MRTMGGHTYHIRTVGMCTSKVAIGMCTSRGGRMNVNPNMHRDTQQNIKRNPRVRVVPIVLPDGGVVGGKLNRSTDFEHEKTFDQLEGKTSKMLEGMESIRIETSEKITEVSENVEMSSALEVGNHAECVV